MNCFRFQAIILLGTLIISAQSISGVSKTSKSDRGAQKGPQLQLSTTTIREEYCDTDHLRLKLRFRFTNSGSETLILFKYSTAIFREMFSRSYKDAMERRYIQDVEPFVDPIISEPIESAIPNEQLVISLKPGESYEIDDDFHVLVFNGTKDTADYLRPGKYFLQIEVPTWWWSQPKAAMLRERWRKYGLLWSDDLTSLPMPINIQKSPSVVRCQ